MTISLLETSMSVPDSKGSKKLNLDHAAKENATSIGITYSRNCRWFEGTGLIKVNRHDNYTVVVMDACKQV